MYRCESNEPDGNVTTIFVFSANLTLKPGNVISSNQAGGVFHKVLNIKTFGKNQFEFIQYLRVPWLDSYTQSEPLFKHWYLVSVHPSS